MSRRIWVYIFPLLFLPNIVGTLDTQYGVIEMSDWLIILYLVSVFWASKLTVRRVVDKLAPWIVGFLIWAFMVTITINLRYDYGDFRTTEFGLLKLAKFILYGLTGYLTSKCLDNESARRRFAKSIIAAVMVLGEIGRAHV